MTQLIDSAFQLKGSLFTLTVLQLNLADIPCIDHQLKKLTTETPNFFKNMPLVIDLANLNEAADQIDFNELCYTLRQYGLIPVGVRNGNPAQLQAANLSGLGTLKQKQAATKSKEPPQVDAPKPRRTKLITQPVRSGQQIYAEGTDLIILASVSAGSEIIADGHIHVYGALRGRALAGVKGDTEARIICSGLGAEIVSIAGRYLLNEAIPSFPGSGPIQIFLNDDTLTCQPI